MFSGLRKQLGRISIRLALWHALLFLAAAFTVLSLSYVVIKKRLDSQEHDVIELRLRQYAGEYGRGGLPAVQILAALRKGREQKAFFVRVADPQNRTLFLRDADDWAEFSPAHLEVERPDMRNRRGWLTLNSPTGSTLLLGFLRLPDESLLEVGRSTEAVQNVLGGFRTATFVVLLIFLPASIAGGTFLASRMLRPVQHLTAAAEQIVATASFDARVTPVETGDELDALVQIFNKMLSRIDRLVRGMRDSLDNVAHDLRTPMTRLRQKAQAAIEAETDLETTRDSLADCVEEAERVMTLLNTLMEIAETESGLVEFQRLPVKIADLVHSAVDSYAEVAEEKGVTVTTVVPPDLCVSGDAGALRRVFVNVLDNAIKYTPSGGHVRITAERDGKSVMTHFADTGCGILAEDLPRVWDRLFRGDKSRSERGLGLGLSFVRAIVDSHGGHATVTSDPGYGSNLCIVLPTGDSTQIR
ncbi:MAG TPA: ATP-binding protein [Chthoniobacter sp.]|jgi:signal transduction histidine kinase